jgi:hypothetical protein
LDLASIDFQCGSNPFDAAIAIGFAFDGRRRETVKHPFGTIKVRMGATHFLTKTLPKVAPKWLIVLAYNLTRVMNIVGTTPLIAAIAA